MAVAASGMLSVHESCPVCTPDPAVVESERNDNGDMIINGECFKKEDRIVLSLS